MISTNQRTVSWRIWTKMTPLCCWKWNLTGASAVQRNPVRKRGLTRKQVIFLPRYSPRIPPSRQVGTVAKVNRLAETELQPSSCASHLISSPNQEISSVDIPSPVSSDFSYQGQVYYETEWPGEWRSGLTWGLTTPENPAPAPMDILSVYMVKQANNCFTRLASSPAIVGVLVETRDSTYNNALTTNRLR